MIYTDEKWVEQGCIDCMTLDLAYGNDENDFKLTVPIECNIPKGALVYIDGTEWGGIVRGSTASTMGDVPTNTIVGSTWHGVMAESYICPDGESYVQASGDAHEAMRRIIERQGLHAMFDVPSRQSGFHVSYQFDRFSDVYTGLRKMLGNCGAKLRIVKDPGRKPMLSAVEARRSIDDGQSEHIPYKISDGTPYNHIIGIGKGELEDRTVVHFYADESGNVSDAKTIYFPGERQYLYELSNEEADKLIEECTKKLKELQSVRTCELELPEGECYDVGDVVGIANDDTGVSVVADVTKVIVKINEHGTATVTNEIGEVTRT